MTPLTASGWLWAGWCLFAACSVVARWNQGEEGLANEWFAVALSIAWLCWLVAP